MEKIDNQVNNPSLTRRHNEERNATIRALIFTLIPIILGIILFWFTAYKISAARVELKQLQKQIDELQEKLKQTRQDLDEAESQLKEAVNLGKWTVDVDMMDIKHIAMDQGETQELLWAILDNRHVQWQLGGRSPQEGFDSPGFAAYILRKVGYHLENDSNLRTRQLLLDSLPQLHYPLPWEPKLVFYKSGYVMFYIEIQDREAGQEMKRFVIGMTPQGVTALKPEFATVEASRSLRRR